MSHSKHLREMEKYIGAELAKYGIKRYSARYTNNGHVIIGFEDKQQQLRSLTISGSTDHMARLRNRSLLRQMMEGRR